MDSSKQTEELAEIGHILLDTKRSMAERFRALFTLRNLGGEKAIRYISDCFTDSSELLKHECAYCLGQMQDTLAIPALEAVLKDLNQQVMVRHEAGEALGAIGSKSVQEILEKYAKDQVKEVAETCELALERIRWLHSDQKEEVGSNPYLSVDPAPPCTDQDTETLRRTLLDETLPLFTRYRAMFALRNSGDDKSVLALAEGLKCSSALFRHEIAYVLGQIKSGVCVPQLTVNLQDQGEVPMVRHECAEALGSIASPECMAILAAYRQDEELVVKESCEIALDMCEYEQSGQFQYADTLGKVADNTTHIS